MNILLAEDHRMMADGLVRLFSRRTGLHVVATAEDGQKAVTMAFRHRPDLVIMDVNLPVLSGIEATRRIKIKHPDIRVIALSMYSNPHFVGAMFRAGADGYVLKDAIFEELLKAIKAVRENRRYLSPGICARCAKGRSRTLSEEELIAELCGQETLFGRLSVRELDVLKQMSDGESTKQIADHFKISVKTVETHRKHICRKLNTRSIAEMTKQALREGLTFLE